MPGLLDPREPQQQPVQPLLGPYQPPNLLDSTRALMASLMAHKPLGSVGGRISIGDVARQGLEFSPGIGDLMSAADAVGYAKEGRPWMAGLSGLGAIPIIGAVGDIMGKGAKVADIPGAALRNIFGENAKFAEGGELILHHGAKRPWTGGFFDLKKIGSGSSAATEGYGAYFATAKKNAERFGPNRYELRLPGELFDQVIDFEKPLSKQSPFVQRQLKRLWTDRTPLEIYKHAKAWRKNELGVWTDPELAQIVDKQISGESVDKLMDFLKRKEPNGGYYTRLFIGDSDPKGIDIYRALAAELKTKKAASDVLHNAGIIGAAFDSSRDLHVADPAAKNVILWDQPTLMGRGIEEWLR